MSLEEKRKQGHYNPIMTVNDLNRIKIGLNDININIHNNNNHNHNNNIVYSIGNNISADPRLPINGKTATANLVHHERAKSMPGSHQELNNHNSNV